MQFPAHCPGELWHVKKSGFVFWQQLLHALEGVAYWLRLEGDGYSPAFPRLRVYPELDREAVDQLSKQQLLDYQQKVRAGAENYFARLTEPLLLEKSLLDPELSNLDIILLQIRHLQYHVGHCNSILREAGLPAVGWRE